MWVLAFCESGGGGESGRRHWRVWCVVGGLLSSSLLVVAFAAEGLVRGKAGQGWMKTAAIKREGCGQGLLW